MAYILQDSSGALWRMDISDLGEIYPTSVGSGAVTPLTFVDSQGMGMFFTALITTTPEFSLAPASGVVAPVAAIQITSPSGIGFTVGADASGEFLILPLSPVGVHAKIIYPSVVLGPTTHTVFLPQGPLVQSPAYSLKVERQDNVAMSGVAEKFWVRTDEFFKFDCNFVFVGADMAGWAAFDRRSLQGSPFDYYPESTQNYFRTFTREDKSAEPAWKSAGLYKLSQLWRLYVA